MAAADPIAQLEQLKKVQVKDEEQRRQLYRAARDLMFEFEDSMDSAYRVFYAPQVLYVNRTAMDLGVFKLLAESAAPLTTSELTEKTKADHGLLLRVLRFIASHGTIQQVGEDKWAANNITRTFANPGFAAGLASTADVIGPTTLAIPDFLANKKYQNPTELLDTPFQQALKTDKSPWDWAGENPEAGRDFAMWMSVQNRPDETWLNVVDFNQFCAGATPETPLFVDVGGGIGHVTVALKQKYPSIPGRMIVQDMAVPAAHRLVHDGVENQVIDFWQGQPIKSARVYYMRNILHDWADHRVVDFLGLIKEAMGPESSIVIDEEVLPEIGAHWRSTSRDITMLSMLASKERTEREWRVLLASAGFEIKEIKQYCSDSSESAIIAVPKK